jgi:Uma2 family endonuclease
MSRPTSGQGRAGGADDVARPSPRLMSLAEFLRWDDGTDRRYELIRGRPVAMALPSMAHARIVPT